ncbi:MAG: hypothetical protein KC550_01795 [Nanoarchaeota archaeon]|nr:hypothetical protein [Nanoarchaeota archaeon]
MEGTDLPLEVKLKTGKFLDVLYKGDIDYSSQEFRTSLHTVVDAYDSEDFKRYRGSFLKLAFMEKGTKIGSRGEDGTNVFLQNYFHVGTGIGHLRQLSKYLKDCINPQIPENIEKELLGRVGMVYTGLELMSMHTEELDKAYRH